MNPVWNTFRKPFVWKPLFVLSIFALNLAMGSKWAHIACWTFFSLIFITIFANPFGRPSDNKKKLFLEKEADSRRLKYGSQFIYSLSIRKKTLGF